MGQQINKSKHTIYALANGRWFPSVKTVNQIEEYTDGAVTFEDFYEQYLQKTKDAEPQEIDFWSDA